jgi:DNA-binding GntR family transcriptional regulator
MASSGAGGDNGVSGSRSSLSDTVYRRIKTDIFDFALLPGERFSENEIAGRLGVSRTPVREALYKLQREGYIDVAPQSGWSVRPFDFAVFEDLYDLRTVLELAAAKRACAAERVPELEALKRVWLVPAAKRLTDPWKVAQLDERFHATLVEAVGNREMARVHHEITERIRIIRRLDFTERERIRHTYDEHAAILKALLARSYREAKLLLTAHIASSKAEVRRITLHKLHALRAPRRQPVRAARRKAAG